MEQFIFPALFYQEEGESQFTVVFPDLSIQTEGDTLVEAFLFAKSYLRVYCSYARKFDMEIPTPSKFEKIQKDFPSFKCMLVDAVIPTNE